MNGGNGTMGRTDVPSAAVTLLRLHLLVDKPECVNVARDKAKDCQTEVDTQVTAAACHEQHRCRREKDGDLEVVLAPEKSRHNRERLTMMRRTFDSAAIAGS